jgi:ADP-ribose pyrophosphatase YjhB (NUDIX family)
VVLIKRKDANQRGTSTSVAREWALPASRLSSALATMAAAQRMA